MSYTGGKLPTPPKTFSKGNRRESVDEQGRSTPLKKRQITNINTRSPLSPTDQSSNKTFQSVKRQLMVRRSPRSKNYCLETSPSPRPPIQLRTEEQDRTDGSMTTSSTASGPCRSSMSLNVISPTCFASLSPEQPSKIYFKGAGSSNNLFGPNILIIDYTPHQDPLLMYASILMYVHALNAIKNE